MGYTARRRGNALFIIVLVILLLGLVTYQVLYKKEKQKVAADLSATRGDPETSLTRFYVERSGNHDSDDEACQLLMQWMTQDDLSWLERNLTRIASLAAETEGAAAERATEPERRRAALRLLLQFGAGAMRPVIVQPQTSGDYGVVYLHEPNHAETMQEVFMKREMGQWKIRRFLGRRDEPGFMERLIKAKQAKGEALDEDERRFQANPQGYAAERRAAMLREAGLTPNPPAR